VKRFVVCTLFGALAANAVVIALDHPWLWAVYAGGAGFDWAWRASRPDS
jgi:hypothetical protein